MRENFHQSKKQLSNALGHDRTSGAKLFDIRIWTVDEVAEYLDVSRGHVYNLVSRREIPFRKKRRGRLYFIPQEIFDWVFEEDL